MILKDGLPDVVSPKDVIGIGVYCIGSLARLAWSAA
jgi:hypothetical protein